MYSNTKLFKFTLLGMMLLAVSTGNSTRTPEEQDARRKALDSMKQETIARLV